MLRGHLVSKTPDDSVIVEPIRKVFQSAIEFVEGCESFEPKQLLLQCSSKSFDAFVSFWTPDEWWTRSNADKSQLILKRMRNELASVIVHQRVKLAALRSFISCAHKSFVELCRSLHDACHAERRAQPDIPQCNDR